MSDDTCAASTALLLSPYATYAAYILAIPTFIWLLTYSIPQLYMVLRPVPDLKKRYNATLVTGAGSGIGKAIAFKLASQGLNVVIVSLDDDFLKTKPP